MPASQYNSFLHRAWPKELPSSSLLARSCPSAARFAAASCAGQGDSGRSYRAGCWVTARRSSGPVNILGGITAICQPVTKPAWLASMKRKDGTSSTTSAAPQAQSPAQHRRLFMPADCTYPRYCTEVGALVDSFMNFLVFINSFFHRLPQIISSIFLRGRTLKLVCMKLRHGKCISIF